MVKFCDKERGKREKVLFAYLFLVLTEKNPRVCMQEIKKIKYLHGEAPYMKV